MAIVEMNKVIIAGEVKYRKKVLEYLQTTQSLELADIDADENGVKKENTVNEISGLKESILKAQEALEIIEKYCKGKNGFFEKRINADVNNARLEAGELHRVGEICDKILNFEEKISNNFLKIEEINTKKKQLIPYMMLDASSSFESENVISKAGYFDSVFDEKSLIIQIKRNHLDNIHFEILSSENKKTYVWFLYLKEVENEVNEFLKTSGFFEEKLNCENIKNEYSVLEETQKSLHQENEEIKRRIIEYKKHQKEIRLFYDRLLIRKQKYEALSKLGMTQNTFIISGFIPKKYTEKIKNTLYKNYESVLVVTAFDKGEAPVMFSNNSFFGAVEQITSDYSMPSENDIDPNPVMAFFYYLFFGMMFSDAGYGLILMIACGILGFSKVLERKKRRIYKMFFFCGVSTTFWGIMYGSFFGDLIDTVSKVFLNSDFRLKPLLLNPTTKPLELLIISVAFGVVHILTALCISFYIKWRQNKKIDAICDSGFWIMAILGISLFSLGIAALQAFKNIGIVIALTGFLGLIITGGRNKKNIIGKIFGGVLSLYDITSYIGDALSYSRLMALGLATGVIASVINVLGSLGGSGPIGVIVFVVVSVFGHSLNFAINCLGAYVHTNRLQYVEFYQKFYEGGGRSFKPLSMNTRYFNFSHK